MDIKNRAKLISLSSKNRVLQGRTERYLKRINELVNREREQRRRVEHLIRSLAIATNKIRAQSATLYRKDLKATERNREIRALREFKATLETAFPDIEENIRTIQESLGDVNTGNATDAPIGSDLE
jgi:chromosome segregation ATPase